MVKLANTKALKTKGCELTEGFQRCVLKTAQLRAQMPLLPPSHSSSSSLRSGSRCTPRPIHPPPPPLPFSTLPYSLLRLNAQKEKKGHHFAN